eukprot:scaffold8637_cov130-Skeletonema_marinoi.AAC.4
MELNHLISGYFAGIKDCSLICREISSAHPSFALSATMSTILAQIEQLVYRTALAMTARTTPPERCVKYQPPANACYHFEIRGQNATAQIQMKLRLNRNPLQSV